MKEANSLRHLLTHLPFNPYCQACVEARSQRKGHRKGGLLEDEILQRYNVPEGKWGSHVACDSFTNTRATNAGGTYYLGDEEIACATTTAVMIDVGTGEIQCYPKATRSEEDTIQAFQRFAGGRPVKYFYCDNAPELMKAAKKMSWMLDTSTPGVPQKNALAERCVRTVKEPVSYTHLTLPTILRV